MSNFRLWGFTTIAAFLLSLAFLMGTPARLPEIEARTVSVREPVIQQVPVYVERIVRVPIIQQVPVYVKQIEYVEVPVELKPFESWHELRVWLANNYIRDAIPDMCVDTALELCQKAWQDGYQMSTELWGDGKREGHMICSTVIGDNIYFMEPSSTFSWLAGVKKSSVSSSIPREQ